MDPKLEEIVAGLRAGGQVADTGYFTLDHEAAQQKTEDFQLGEPRDCLARLAEMVGRLDGQLTVVPSHQGLTAMLHRVHLSRWEAEGAMMVGLIVPRTEREMALRDLSLAMRAMTHTARGAITLVSNDGEGAYRCVYDGIARGKVEPLRGNTRITSVHLPLRRLALPLAWANPWNSLEVQRLRARVRWARTDVAYGRQPLSYGLPTHLEARVHERIDDADALVGIDWAYLQPRNADAPESVFRTSFDEVPDAVIASARWRRKAADEDMATLYQRYAPLSDAGTLHVLVRGVHLERSPLPELPVGVVVVLDVNDAHRDLSQAKIRRDERFEHRLAQLQRKARGDLAAKIEERLAVLGDKGRNPRVFGALQRVQRRL